MTHVQTKFRLETILVDNEDEDWVQLWLGSRNGCIHLLELRTRTTHTSTSRAEQTCAIEVLTSINHYEPMIDGIDVKLMCNSRYDHRYVWTYVFPGRATRWIPATQYICPGSTLYQWSTSTRAIVSKLDVSKIMPCSETLSTLMNMDESIEDSRTDG
jgi:hypothetical protein